MKDRKITTPRIQPRFFTGLLLLCLLAMALPAAAKPIQEAKKLLIISGYNEADRWSREMMGLVTYFSDRDEHTMTETVYMNNILLTQRSYFDQIQNSIFVNNALEPPDGVVLIGNITTTLMPRIKKEWGNIPIILITRLDLFGTEDFYLSGSLEEVPILEQELRSLESIKKDYNFTSIYVPEYIPETVDMMVEMLPEMEELVFLADRLYINRYCSVRLERYVRYRYPNLKYRWLEASAEAMPELEQMLLHRDPKRGLLYSTWYFTETNVHGWPMINSGSLNLIFGSANPVFAMRSCYLSAGFVGGCFPSQADLQKAIGVAYKEMAADGDMHKVPFYKPARHYPMVNYQRMLEFNIPKKLCPVGTVFVNAPESFWKRYRTLILSFAAIMVLLSAVLIMRNRNAQRRIRMLNTFNELVNNMPIAYSQAQVKVDALGDVVDVESHSGNHAFDEILNHNTPGNVTRLFPLDFLAEKVSQVMRTGRPITFSYHFAPTDTYYQFLIYPPLVKHLDTIKGRSKRRDIDIFAIDITERKRQEFNLIEAREKAKESDKMKSAFLANMSHEIRTPLNAIVGFSKLLVECDNPEERQQFADIIDANNTMLLQLINDVLDLAKIESNTLDFIYEPTDLNQTMRMVHSSIGLRVPQGVQLNMVLGTDDCVMVTDGRRLMQVITNFLTNACKFTQRGSISFGYELEGDQVYFFVKDTGIGLSKEDQMKLFVRFSKLNNFRQGNGLGLSICKSIVEKMGGSIGVESRGKGKGSLFWFTLPFEPPAKSPAANQSKEKTQTIS